MPRIMFQHIPEWLDHIPSDEELAVWRYEYGQERGPLVYTLDIRAKDREEAARIVKEIMLKMNEQNTLQVYHKRLRECAVKFKPDLVSSVNLICVKKGE